MKQGRSTEQGLALHRTRWSRQTRGAALTMGKCAQMKGESAPRAAMLRRATLAVVITLTLCATCKAVVAQGAPDHEALLAQARTERAAGHRVEALGHCQEV